MGYEVTRFTHEIDEEFHCSICTMVFKDPVQSPCEHLFCNDCIRQWLAVKESCPVERKPLKLEDLKPALRTVRNFVNKFEIKCDFEPKGCQKLVKLENLQDHVARCEFNPNAQSDETSKFTSETSNKSKILVDERPEFRVLWENGKIYIKQNVLEVNGGWGYAQSIKPLKPTKFSFKFQILNLGDLIRIGLAPMCPSGGTAAIAALYRSDGWSNFNEKSEERGRAWKFGDIIECGINFPRDFVNDGRDVRVYFNKNGKLMGEGLVAMPIDGLFPTVTLYGGSKMKYLSA